MNTRRTLALLYLVLLAESVSGLRLSALDPPGPREAPAVPPAPPELSASPPQGQGVPQPALAPPKGPDSFAPGPTTSDAPTIAVPIEPGEMTATPANTPIAVPVSPRTAAPNAPKGTTISETQSQSRVIEDDRPERVQVFPDDPESAWWEINPHYAFDRAQREQRPLMLLFTGIWNTQAMALSQEVFATKSFNNYVKENLVICYLSYPRNYTDAPDALRKIKDRFKVKGYPNVLIFNPNGEVERGIRGYRTGRPVDYFNALTTACRPVLESVKVQKEALIARGYRNWSNYLGKEIFAKFIRHDQVRVMIQDAAGQRWTLPINDLAPEDQKMVESFPGVAKVEDE